MDDKRTNYLFIFDSIMVRVGYIDRTVKQEISLTMIHNLGPNRASSAPNITAAFMAPIEEDMLLEENFEQQFEVIS